MAVEQNSLTGEEESNNSKDDWLN